MEQNQNPVAPVQPPAPAQTTPKKMSLVDTLNSLPKKVLSLVKKPQTSKLPKIKIPKKIIIAVVALFVILMVLMMVVRLMKGGRSNVFPVTPTPSPTATPEVEVLSQYADDEDVKKIQEKMQALDRDLNEAQFRDDRLRIPTLDWEVEFED